MVYITSHFHKFRYAHLLEGSRILLCLVDSNPEGKVMILLDRLSHIDAAIQSRSYAKFFHKDKIGEACLFSFDESKRLLAVYTSLKVCPFPLLISCAPGDIHVVDATPYVPI